MSGIFADAIWVRGITPALRKATARRVISSLSRKDELKILIGTNFYKKQVSLYCQNCVGAGVNALVKAEYLEGTFGLKVVSMD